MKFGRRETLLCNCENTMPLGDELKRACAAAGADGEAKLHENLCRREAAAFEKAAADGPLLVACLQEAPIFSEMAEEKLGEAADIRFVDIRDSGGWSDEAEKAAPKQAALLAAAAVEMKPAGTVPMTSEGVALIYGRDEAAIAAAGRLAAKLDVTVLLKDPVDVIPPRIMDIPVYRGRIAGLRGHLGAFELVVDDYGASLPAARGALAFEPPRNGASSKCDVILDLTGDTPLITAPDKRDGYFRPDARDPAAVERALFEMADLVGEFEKPRYVAYHADICAHGASRQTGCSKCLDVCPAGAIQSDGDKVAYDPYICGGCGGCASVCPTGAAEYALAGGDGLANRLRALLTAYEAADGRTIAGPATVLFHDERWGADQISMLARFGDGLPAHVLPIAVHEVTQISFDLLAAAFAWGAGAVRLAVPPQRRDEIAGLAAQIGLVGSILGGLGHGEDRIDVITEDDPDALGAALRSSKPKTAPKAGGFLPMGGKRSVAWLAFRHLHAHAPEPTEQLALPPGAPFGAVNVDQDACTLCLACVSSCPAGALLDDQERPRLSFLEDACVQCGLCKTICPENAISLDPRLNFTPEAKQPVEKKTEEPFNCVRCGKPFGSRGSIAAIVTKLSGKHWMFAEGGAADKIMMCEDCRVVVQFVDGQDPMAMGERPRIRTTDDDLRERDAARAKGLPDPDE